MSNFPDDLKYANSHEWARLEEGGVVRIGISDFAQGELGDVVFVDLPDSGRRVTAGEAVAVIESVKAASDIYSPVSGEILETNTALKDAPEAVNADPYSAWLFAVKADDPAELDRLMSAQAYAEAVRQD
jgi:glycine cleavage system H protein